MRHAFHLALASLVFPACAHAQTVLYVNAGLATGAGTGQSWADAFRGATALQQAIEAAAPIAGTGQTVQVWTAAGTYVPSTPSNPGDPNSVTFTLLSSVELYGGFAGGETAVAQRNVQANVTTLSGLMGSAKAHHVVTSSGADSTGILDGFTIRDGFSSEEPQGRGHGAGILNLGGSPLVRFCTITANSADTGSYLSGGGGVFSPAGSPRFEDCLFSQNVSEQGGALGGHAVCIRCTFTGNRANAGANGGAINGDVTCEQCTFSGNHATGFGGAVSGTGTLTDCLFQSNTTDAGGGGALHSGPFTATRCAFLGNTSVSGTGGALLYNAGSVFSDCTFQQNSAPYEGATLKGPVSLVRCRVVQSGNDTGYNYLELAPGSSMTNCLLSQNLGTVRAADGVALVNCTFFNCSNQYGAVRTLTAGTTVSITNCAFWDYRSSPVLPRHLNTASGGSFVVGYSDVQNLEGSVGGVGNFSADPRLDADGRLRSPSPCIDAGNSAAVPPGTATDLFGQPRFVDDPGMPNTGAGTPPVDIGAFEFQGTSCYANCDGSTAAPTLNVLDFTCFLQAFAGTSPYANCDASTAMPALNVLDFTCFLQKFAAGCP